MRSNYWTNADGLKVGFGTADTRNEMAGGVETKGRVRQLEMKVYYDKDITEADVRASVIPAGATVLSAKTAVTTAFAGGTAITLGTIGTDGTGADADAVITATEGAVANLTEGAVVEGAGTLIGTTTSADVNLTYATTGSFTAGEATVIVEYIMPAA